MLTLSLSLVTTSRPALIAPAPPTTKASPPPPPPPPRRTEVLVGQAIPGDRRRTARAPIVSAVPARRAGAAVDAGDATGAAGAAKDEGLAATRAPGAAHSGIVDEGIARRQIETAAAGDIDGARRGAAGAAATTRTASAAVTAGRRVVSQDGVTECQRAGIVNATGGGIAVIARAIPGPRARHWRLLRRSHSRCDDQSIECCADAGIDDELGEVAGTAAAIDGDARRRRAGLQAIDRDIGRNYQ